MGGFHLVEPVEGNSISPEADVQLMASTPLVDGTNPDAEKGRNMPKPEEGRVTILTLEMLEELAKDPEFEIQVTEDEIMDKSKGDALSKIIFILQSSWFIMQCAARHMQGLSFTQLELTTLALASLNGITFILWWDKPLGAQLPVRVYLKRKLRDVERKVEGVSDCVAGTSILIPDWQLQRGQSSRSKLVPDLQDFFKAIVTTIRDVILSQSEAVVFVAWLIVLPLAVVALLLFPIITFTGAFFYTIKDLVDESTSFPADATHVPTFYVPNHHYSKWIHAWLLIALGSTFGGIHCAGWNFPFPAYAEQKLWRAASLAVTTIPIAAFPFTVTVSCIVTPFLSIFKSSPDTDDSLRFLTFSISMLAYVSARLVLLGLALALLRHLPQSTYITVDWTKFYPHIL